MTKRERELREKLDLIDYYNVEIARLGGKYNREVDKGAKAVLCPFHDDNNPSLSIYRGKDGLMRYHCFACGGGGGVIEVHKRLNRERYKRELSREEVIEELSRKFGIELKEEEEEEGKKESIFARAKRELQIEREEKPRGYIGIVEYREANERLIGYKLTKSQKISSYNKLDIQMYVSNEERTGE